MRSKTMLSSMDEEHSTADITQGRYTNERVGVPICLPLLCERKLSVLQLFRSFAFSAAFPLACCHLEQVRCCASHRPSFSRSGLSCKAPLPAPQLCRPFLRPHHLCTSGRLILAIPQPSTSPVHIFSASSFLPSLFLVLLVRLQSCVSLSKKRPFSLHFIALLASLVDTVCVCASASPLPSAESTAPTLRPFFQTSL